MPRVSRGLADNHVYHVLNRGNGRQHVFAGDGDFSTFLELMAEARQRYAVQILGFCLLYNHFHLLLKPACGNDLSRFMQWLLTSHVRRYHRVYGSSGHVWQGRFKSFLVQENQHFLTVLRYVEANPVRNGMVASARKWQWSSHRQRVRRDCTSNLIDEPAVELPPDWGDYVDQPLTEKEILRLRRSFKRQAPFGDEGWQMKVCEKYGLESTIRKRGRPPRG